MISQNPRRRIIARGRHGTVECAIRNNGRDEASEFLASAECRKFLPALLVLFQKYADAGPDDADIRPKPLRATKICEFIKGQTRVFCYQDGNAWVLTNGDMKKSTQTPKANIERAERIMAEDQSRQP